MNWHTIESRAHRFNLWLDRVVFGPVILPVLASLSIGCFLFAYFRV